MNARAVQIQGHQEMIPIDRNEVEATVLCDDPFEILYDINIFSLK